MTESSNRKRLPKIFKFITRNQNPMMIFAICFLLFSLFSLQIFSTKQIDVLFLQKPEASEKKWPATPLDQLHPEQLKLVQLITMTRHGTTTPGMLFPNDPNREEWANIGPPEALTTTGVREHCNLGFYLAERYGGFITDKMTIDSGTKIWRYKASVLFFCIKKIK